MMKTASPVVSPIATNRTFHHVRDSVTSYARFSVETMAVSADELVQIAPRTPMVISPPLFPVASSVI